MGEKVCCVCSKPSTFKCSKCNTVRYCSRDCQRGDWKRHKRVECVVHSTIANESLKVVQTHIKAEMIRRTLDLHPTVSFDSAVLCTILKMSLCSMEPDTYSELKLAIIRSDDTEDTGGYRIVVIGSMPPESGKTYFVCDLMYMIRNGGATSGKPVEVITSIARANMLLGIERKPPVSKQHAAIMRVMNGSPPFTDIQAAVGGKAKAMEIVLFTLLCQKTQESLKTSAPITKL